MNFLLMATALMLYTQATETKECSKYVFTEITTGYDKYKGACEDLNGVVASEDLKDRKNAEVAKVAYEKLREKEKNAYVYIGITVRNTDQAPDASGNPFVFSDGTEFDDGNFLKWQDDDLPEYKTDLRCTALFDSDGGIIDTMCDLEGRALCYVESTCPSSASELSRANLPLFALFATVGAFSAFRALAALVF